MFYALYPEQGREQKRYLDAERIGARIVITENFHKRAEELQKYQPGEAHKLLGILTDPAGTLAEHINYMTGQARDWNKRMKGSLLPQRLKLVSFQSELAPKLKYPLPAISISKRDSEQIMKPALP